MRLDYEPGVAGWLKYPAFLAVEHCYTNKHSQCNKSYFNIHDFVYIILGVFGSASDVINVGNNWVLTN